MGVFSSRCRLSGPGRAAAAAAGGSSLLTGDLLGFDVAWHVLFFGLLLTWHGLMMEVFLTLSISAGIAGSTILTCAAGAAALYEWSVGQDDAAHGILGLLCVALVVCTAASAYLLFRILQTLRKISR